MRLRELHLMIPFDSGFGNNSERSPTSHGSPLERGVQAVSIAGGIVAIIAGILSFLKGGYPYLIWIVVGTAVFLTSPSFCISCNERVYITANRHSIQRAAIRLRHTN